MADKEKFFIPIEGKLIEVEEDRLFRFLCNGSIHRIRQRNWDYHCKHYSEGRCT